MAILMVYDKDNTHTDPGKDRRGCYKRGYVVEVLDDGKPLVVPPAPPFLFVRVIGMPKQDALIYQGMEYGIPDTGGRVSVTRRRAFRLELENLPAENQSELAKNRYTEISWGQLRSRLKNISTGLKE